VDQSPGQAPQS